MTFSAAWEAAFDCVYLVQLKKAVDCRMYCNQREPVSDQYSATGLKSHIARD